MGEYDHTKDAELIHIGRTTGVPEPRQGKADLNVSVRRHNPNPEHGQRVGVISGSGQISNHVSDQRVRDIFLRRVP